MDYEIIGDEPLDLSPALVRSPGVHLTDCTRAAAVSLGLLDPEVDDGGDGPMPPRVQLGHAFEEIVADLLERKHPGRFVRVGELECDGMYFTPDLVDMRPPRPKYGSRQPNEIKLTWMSSTHTPDSAKWWLYRAQLMGQCWGLRSLTGVLRVGFVQSAEWRPVRFYWTKQELAEHWAMLKSVKRVIEHERAVQARQTP